MEANTESFIRAFSTNDVPNIVTKFFDELMVLYNLLGRSYYNDIGIQLNHDDENLSATFDITFASNKQGVYEIHRDFNHTSFNVYDTPFNISVMPRTDTTATIVIER